MALVPQENLAAGHGFQDTSFALHTEIFRNAAMAGNQANHTFREMGVEVVADDAPQQVRRGGAELSVEEVSVILFLAAVANHAFEFSGSDIEAAYQGLGSVADILEFTAFNPARFHWQTGRDPFKRLDAGHLVDG